MLLIKSLVVLCSAVAVMAQSNADAVASALVFFGEDTTESLDPLDVFKNPINHATAVSSVLVFSGNQAGFKPSEKTVQSLAPAFGEFVQKATTFPGFIPTSSLQKHVSLKNETTVEQFEHAIRESFSAVPHIGKIAFKFASLLPLHQEDESLKTWILSVIVLEKPKDVNKVRIQFARVNLKIAYGQACVSTDAYIPEQQASVIFGDYEANSMFMSANAQQLADLMPIVDVEHTIAFFTSSDEPDVDQPFAFDSQQRVFSF